MYSKIAIALLFLFGLVTLASECGAQTKSNFGKEFYLSFPANSDGADILALYLTGRTKTACNITIPKLGYSKTVTINPGAVTIVNLPTYNPFAASALSAEIRIPEVLMLGNAVHIRADSDIVVYGYTHIHWSSDAFLALPETAIGADYLALSYQTFSESVSGFSKPYVYRSPGEFVIAANQDSTSVEITPACKTLTGKPANQPFQVLLNEGDVYLVQSDTSSSADDLTGSHIVANKSISVLSGHHDTSIPDTGIKWTRDTSRTSTNTLVEELPPVSSWGNSAVVIPFATSQAPDLIRILSAEDGNTISVNGTNVAVLSAGQFYEMQGVSRPLVIRSTNPMLVGQYMHSTVDSIQYGDPSLTLVYPVEQYDTAYTIMVVQDTIWLENFLTITTETSNVGTVELDGAIIPATSFQQIAGSLYSYTQLRVNQGVHNLRAARGFGVTVYALGEADSYSYPGGALLKLLVPASSRFVGFDSTLLCQPEERTVWIANPNSVPATLTTASILEANPSIFSIQVSLPITIPPDDSIAIPVTFAPDSAGSFSAILNLSFSSPRHQSISIPLSAVGSTLPASLWAPRNTRLLAGESFEMPVWAESDLSPYRIQAFRIALSYDPRYLQWYDVDQNNTLSYYSYFQPSGFPGSDTLAFQFVQDSSINGGGVSDPRPLAYLKFHTSADGENMATFYQSLDIHYNVIVDRGAIGDLCLAKIEPPGHIVLDSTCGSPALLTDSTIATLSSIEPNYPNPASATTVIPFTVGSLRRESPSSTPEAPVSLKLYNALGSLVAQPIDGTLSEGLHVCQLDCTNFPKGMYVIELNVAGKHYRRKMIVTR